MKKYFSFFRIRFIAGVQYRAAAWAGVVTQFVWGVMTIVLFKAFYQTNPDAFPISFQATATYVWLQQSFLAIFMLWKWDKQIFEEITGGGIAYTLIRPIDPYNMWFVRCVAGRLADVMLRCLPILSVAVLLPAPYGIGAPASPPAFLLFLLAMALGFLNVVAFSMFIYIGTFYTMNPMGIRTIAVAAGDFLTGGLIPLPFLPAGVRSVLELTPFASMQNLPFLIYSGSVTGSALWKGIFLQLFWLAVMLLCGKLWLHSTAKRVVVQGG